MTKDFKENASDVTKRPQTRPGNEAGLEAELGRLKGQRAKPTQQMTLTMGGSTEKAVHTGVNQSNEAEIEKVEKLLQQAREDKRSLSRNFNRKR